MNLRFSSFRLTDLVQGKAQLKLANNQGPDGLVKRTERHLFKISERPQSPEKSGPFRAQKPKIDLKWLKNGLKW